MAKKEVKQIRVVYFPGDSTSEYYSDSRERLEIQVWDNKEKSWDTATSLPFTFSTEWEGQKEPCYLHYCVLKDVCNWCYHGYTLLGWFNVNDLDD